MTAGPTDQFNTSTPEFDILSSANDDRSISGATDGSMYLVGFSTRGIVRSFLISGGGTVGAQASTGRTGSDPMVAFDGTNYLLAWTDQNAGPTGPSNVFGQLIDASGNKSGSLLRITTEGSVTLAGVAWGGGQYLVTYLRDNLDGTTGLYGRFVSAAGASGARILITNAFGSGTLNDVATDGTDFLVAWQSGTSGEVVKARVLQGGGTLGQVATLNSSPEPSTQSLGVAYTGGNYLVTWSDSVGLNESNVYGRLVTAAGVCERGTHQHRGRHGPADRRQCLGAEWEFPGQLAEPRCRSGQFHRAGTLPDVGRCAHGYGAHPVYHRRGETADQLRPVANGNDALYLINRADPGPTHGARPT